MTEQTEAALMSIGVFLMGISAVAFVTFYIFTYWPK